MKWLKKLIHKIDEAFGLIYNPEEGLKFPETEKPKTVQPKPQLDPDVRVTATGLWRVSEEENRVNFTRVSNTKEAKASNELTEAELILIQEKTLDIHTAVTLKTIWVTGLSCKDAATRFNGERGFSERTISKYWSVFNATIKSE